MRLSKIKLAGFKSFVDPTAVNFPSNLIGVVGPNGCGKSNIIDAVRWVMGEISAKHLRGDSMADVVFNGSSSRKPVGTASVELVFDNSDGSLGGQYAGFAEVSLKRVVSRDGASAYFLNGARCRRKDITQLFLGTGLGARSYAIIEQGMISRVIEARPEELRGFIEEAAGISKYKERRRETENRISHTRENLDRLNDVREEVEKQLRHLQRQAATARRYQSLKQDERKLTAELLALRLRSLEQDAHGKEGLLSERDTAMQGLIAELRSIEATIETAREEFTEASEALNTVQGRYYQIGAEISRGEQAIAHARELRQRQKRDFEQADQGAQETRLHLTRDQARVDELRTELQELEPNLEAARRCEQASAAALSQAEGAMQDWQERWEAFNRDARAASETTQVERARIEQLEHQLARLAAQRERLAGERAGLSTVELEQRIAALTAEQEQAAARAETTAAQLDEVVQALQRERERERELVATDDRSRRTLQESQGRLLSLEALQRAALGLAQNKVGEWLSAHALDERPRLAQQLVVEPGWERAVETVLGSYLEAVSVDAIDGIAGQIDTLQAGAVSFFRDGAGERHAEDADRLLGRVQGPPALAAFLTGIIAVDTLAQALEKRRDLRAGESVITRDGLWIGREWLRVSRDQDVHAGVIEREQEMRKLRQDVELAARRREAVQDELAQARSALTEHERQRDFLQSEANQLHRAQSERGAKLANALAQTEQMTQRIIRIEAETQELERDHQERTEALAEARGGLQEGMDAMVEFEAIRGRLEPEREVLRQNLGEKRRQAQADRDGAQEVAIKVESKRSALTSISGGFERLQQQLERMLLRREELTRQLAEGEAPLEELAARLEHALQQRMQVEQELSAARHALEEAESRMRSLDQRRLDSEAAVEDARAGLEDVRLAAQALKVRRESLLEQFEATSFDLESVYQEMEPEAGIDAWEKSLAEVGGKIERLGQVNLAAISEFEEQSERKEYLDRQFKDLTDALETLDTAIRKIDRETRSRFQDTFDKVNAGLKDRFPRLFGGGHAYLELAGEDVLNAGVSIMARPPGKRNSTINQLSGGEKALTAVALVFSIFELNPAPFCLLDEVDAPLDDNNVGRFCATVKEMSERVQFIFITHNKTTMELASQLIGVTMNEPGVSRLVAVDVDEAVRMAAM
ncbi:chromosome segregation protein SMC [Steroidobacter denitrificans]|uniref:Chromosome partition protein Smc n=1 Tax=Steroidobacter denitrificans TaxID=465721 RepID=A0A127FB67_STEDE|nr:chromosome segregation protein SMC [Steroidobacter denitrificans]AMN46848.1 chromosome segregation protein SMC [Steroidobacter denitrificans]